jgi:hypothetical protein
MSFLPARKASLLPTTGLKRSALQTNKLNEVASPLVKQHLDARWPIVRKRAVQRLTA